MTTEGQFNILAHCKPGTQKYILAQIFSENRNEWITKREVEKQMVLRWALRNIDIKKYDSVNSLINDADSVPGDIQRDLRLFYDKFKNYGLIKRDKNKEAKIELSYKWSPIDNTELKNIVHPAARNILKTDEEIESFYRVKNYTCEICSANKKLDSSIRLAVDHWRAHSVYNIDNIDIAVLLCEKCNNIHHNYDAVKIALKYKNNLNIVKRWIQKETEIRNKGFLPNDDDLKTQKEVINKIIDHYKELNPIVDEFWENLL